MRKHSFDNCKRENYAWCIVDDLPIFSSSTEEPEESSTSYSSEYSYSEQEELFYTIVYCDI